MLSFVEAIRNTAYTLRLIVLFFFFKKKRVHEIQKKDMFSKNIIIPSGSVERKVI